MLNGTFKRTTLLEVRLIGLLRRVGRIALSALLLVPLCAVSGTLIITDAGSVKPTANIVLAPVPSPNTYTTTFGSPNGGRGQTFVMPDTSETGWSVSTLYLRLRTDLASGTTFPPAGQNQVSLKLWAWTPSNDGNTMSSWTSGVIYSNTPIYAGTASLPLTAAPSTATYLKFNLGQQVSLSKNVVYAFFVEMLTTNNHSLRWQIQSSDPHAAGRLINNTGASFGSQSAQDMEFLLQGQGGEFISTTALPSTDAGRQTLPRNGPIEVQFSSAVNPGTAAFIQILDCRGGYDVLAEPRPINGTWTIGSGRTNALFTPAEPFVPGALVTTRVPTTVMSESGLPLAAEQLYSFLVDDGVDYGAIQTFLPAFKMVNNGTHSLEMRIYRPASGPGPFPAMFWVHGGGWSGGTLTNSDAGTLDTYLTRHLEVALISVAYRCQGSDGTFTEALSDVDAAMAYIRDNAAVYNIDTNRFGLYGGSAGTPLASLLAQQNSSVRCFIGYNGIYNFVSNPGSSFPGGTGYQQDVPSLAANSAIFNLRPSPPAVLLMHGALDTTISNSQSILFGQKVAEAWSYAKVCIYEGQTHGFFNHAPMDLITLAEVKAHIAETLLSDGRWPDGFAAPRFGGPGSQPALVVDQNVVWLRMANLMPWKTNVVECRADLSAGSWTNLTTLFPASTHEAISVPRNPAATSCYYRFTR